MDYRIILLNKHTKYAHAWISIFGFQDLLLRPLGIRLRHYRQCTECVLLDKSIIWTSRCQINWFSKFYKTEIGKVKGEKEVTA